MVIIDEVWESAAAADSKGDEFNGSGRAEKQAVETRGGKGFPEGRGLLCM